MLTTEDQQLIDKIAVLCEKTGTAILSFYNTPDSYRVIRKENHTPLTDADMTAHNILVDGLPHILPLPCLSEESEPSVHCTPPETYWLIDPIDGTREFIERTGEFCILIALIQHARPVLSFIYAPTVQHYWYALTGKGAYFCNRHSNIRLYCKPAQENALTVITARPKISHRMRHYLTTNFPDYRMIHRGSALKFCAIAEGKADIYPKLSRTTCQWDVAAGDLLLQEAGGRLRFDANQIPLYGNGQTVNPPFLAFGAGFSEAAIARYFSSMQEILYGKS